MYRTAVQYETLHYDMDGVLCCNTKPLIALTLVLFIYKYFITFFGLILFFFPFHGILFHLFHSVCLIRSLCVSLSLGTVCTLPTHR